MFAEVAVLRPVANTYTYKIPIILEERIKIGQKVTVPFGYGSVDGIVLSIQKIKPKFKTKEIISIKTEEPVLRESLSKLALWMFDYYQIFPESILNLMIPKGVEFLGSREKSDGKQHITVPKLTINEEEAVNNIKSGNRQRYLLFTNQTRERYKVYLNVYNEMTTEDNVFMFMFPEISQAEDFYNYFLGYIKHSVYFWNAGLNPKEKLHIWQKCRSNEARCIIGTRSLIFLPCKDIKVIAVDEEESPFYKSEKNPKYLLSEVAKMRAKFEKAIYLIGTSSPSIEAYAEIKEREVKLLEKMELLDLRRKERKPQVEVINIKEEQKVGFQGFLSTKLRKLIIESKNNNEKTVLFYNRRGFFTYVFCKSCGKELVCPRCNKALIYDQKKKFYCHTCNYVLEKKPLCSNCSGTNFKYSGAGTQKIISELKHLVFNSNIIRADKDILKNEKDILQKYEEFIKTDNSILIGTQLVFHPYLEHKIDLFVFLNFDQIINFPDFHIAERAYQILNKAKRLVKKNTGKIIVQTRHPEYYVLEAFISQDYDKFYNEEIKRRKELNYPPFKRIAKILVWGDDLGLVEGKTKAIYKRLKLKSKDGGYEIFEPQEAPQEKLRDKYYWQLILKGNDLKILRKDFNDVVVNIKTDEKSGVILDFDPQRI